jgi:hypothetical protein
MPAISPTPWRLLVVCRRQSDGSTEVVAHSIVDANGKTVSDDFRDEHDALHVVTLVNRNADSPVLSVTRIDEEGYPIEPDRNALRGFQTF